MWPSVGYPVKKNEIKFTEIWEHSETEKAYLLKRLMMIGHERTKYYMDNNWIVNDETGFTGWRWDRYNVPIRIVSACNRYKDVLVCAPRHSCPLMTMAMASYGGMKVLHEYSGKDHEQGFVDQFGTFYTREEAYVITVNNGQLLKPENCHNRKLFSEGLY